MSLALLRHLQEKRAFDSSPLRHDLGVYHVPFSELGSDTSPEQTLVNAARRTERLMIVGPSGSGKSSLIEYALGPTVEGIAGSSPFSVGVGFWSVFMVRLAGGLGWRSFGGW